MAARCFGKNSINRLDLSIGKLELDWFILALHLDRITRHRNRNFLEKSARPTFSIKYTGSQKVSIAINTLLILVFRAYNGFIFTSYSVKEQAIDLAFPLKDGAYYVGHGGNHAK